jgi:site-specific recombinase XerD
MNPVKVKGPQLLKWILYLKNTGIGHSRLENHHYALKSFFAFLQKTGDNTSNSAQALPLLIKRRRQRTKPISTQDAFKLLVSFDQSSWHGLRNYTMVSLFWALGLRTSELTGLKVRSFETGHGKRIGLLRVRGKNKKQRALFVVDRLFDELIRYLSHPKAPKKKCAPFFQADTKTTAISNDRVQRLVKDQAKKAGIKADVTPRVLRHSFATEMYHQKVPLSDIQVMMGHDSIADTSIYIHVSDKLKQLALDSILISRRFSWQ